MASKPYKPGTLVMLPEDHLWMLYGTIHTGKRSWGGGRPTTAKEFIIKPGEIGLIVKVRFLHNRRFVASSVNVVLFGDLLVDVPGHRLVPVKMS